MSIFEQATRLKLRFETNRGMLSVEDLWDLPLQSETRVNLDNMARTLNRQIKAAAGDESFVKPEVKSNVKQEVKGNVEQELRFEIIKHVIAVRVAERDARVLEQAKNKERQELMEALDDLDKAERKGMTREQLKARLAAL